MLALSGGNWPSPVHDCHQRISTSATFGPSPQVSVTQGHVLFKFLISGITFTFHLSYCRAAASLPCLLPRPNQHTCNSATSQSRVPCRVATSATTLTIDYLPSPICDSTRKPSPQVVLGHWSAGKDPSSMVTVRDGTGSCTLVAWGAASPPAPPSSAIT